MKRWLVFVVCVGTLSALVIANVKKDNPPLAGNFYLDSDPDSDIDPGAENWTNGYFGSSTVDKLPVYNNFHDWLKQMTRLYKWRLLKAEEKNGYYFALFAIGMNSSELAFCFHHVFGENRQMQLEVQDVSGKNIRLKQWGPNSSLVQEYRVVNPKTGEVIKRRELNGYIIRMHRFPRHLRVICREINDSRKIVFNEMVENIVDSVRGIQEIKTQSLPDTATLETWSKEVALPSWKLLKKTANKSGFFAVYKVNAKTFAFCRQFKVKTGMYERESTLKLTDLQGKPLPLVFTAVTTLNRRYRLVKEVDHSVQVVKYSIIDGAEFRAQQDLPPVFRLQYILQTDNDKPTICFNEEINFYETN
ncbi:hypothetical protein P0136_13010 [Lentisphaerota bacterium ZTH]|nr:hypothetical protein JYG24_09475 [Lentisphaerota bacterium]WET06278.1 hypothetical protein P0136_13010 [Lentisphaerota bacterium ZTH]